MLQIVRAEKVHEKTEVICLASMFPSWVMVLELSKKVHFLQFYVAPSKKPKPKRNLKVIITLYQKMIFIIYICIYIYVYHWYLWYLYIYNIYLKIVKTYFCKVSLWFILVCKIPQFWAKATVWTVHHTFLERRHPEVTKSPYYISSPEGSQKRYQFMDYQFHNTFLIFFKQTSNYIDQRGVIVNRFIKKYFFYKICSQDNYGFFKW